MGKSAAKCNSGWSSTSSAILPSGYGAKLLSYILMQNLLSNLRLNFSKLFHFEHVFWCFILPLSLLLIFKGFLLEELSLLLHVVLDFLALGGEGPTVTVDWVQEVLDGITLHVTILYDLGACVHF